MSAPCSAKKTLASSAMDVPVGNKLPSPSENMSCRFGNLRMRATGPVIRSASSPRATCAWAFYMLGLTVAPPSTITPAYWSPCERMATLNLLSKERSKASGNVLSTRKPKTTRPASSIEAAKRLMRANKNRPTHHQTASQKTLSYGG